MRIILVVQSFECGGAERNSVNLINYLKDSGFKVSVIVLNSHAKDFFIIPAGVDIIRIDPPTRSYRNLQTVLNVRGVIRNIDPVAVISFMMVPNIISVLSLLGRKTPIIITELYDPSMLSVGPIWFALRRAVYPLCNRLVSVSAGVDSHYDWIPIEKRSVIYSSLGNMNDKHEDLPNSLINSKSKYIVSMGRLTNQKGFDILIRAFSLISEKNKNWNLIILGDGKLMKSLQLLINDLNLSDRIKLPGSMRNPFYIIKKCNLFVMPSRFEGFGNVLIEAMYCGLPVISSNCPSGPSEIVTDGKDGVFFDSENINDLATKLNHLIADKKMQDRLVHNATDTVKRFDYNVIHQQWHQLICKILQ